MTMRLQSIEHFITIVETGSIRGAARMLGMSQPALTRSLQQLESDLGVLLMQRGVHGASLTLEGTTFLVRARVAHAELSKAVEEAKNVNNAASALVNIGLSPVAGSLVLPEFFTRLHRQQPNTRIRILQMAPSTLLSMVRESAADFALTQRTKANIDAGLQFHPLFDVQLRIGARPGHPLAGRRDLHELANAKWLAPTAPGISDDIISQSFLAIGLPAPVPMVHCGSNHILIDLATESDMLVPLPSPLLRSCVEDGRLIEIPLGKPLVPLIVGLYTRTNSLPNLVTQTTIHIIVDIARRLSISGELRSTAPIPTGRKSSHPASV